MNIVASSRLFHDAAGEEEGFSRIKHDGGFPIQTIEVCLRTSRLRAGFVWQAKDWSLTPLIGVHLLMGAAVLQGDW